MKPACPYCNREAELTPASRIYPKQVWLHHKKLWACLPCGAWVGCHDDTEIPLGRLANAELRKCKQLAHAAFDPKWRYDKRKAKPRGIMTRSQAYEWLAGQMGLPVNQTHIGMFDIEQCKRVVEVCG